MNNRRAGGCILSSMKSLFLAGLAAALLAPVAVCQSPDFEFYRTRVEPIFLKKRPERTRCVVCHSSGRRAFNLAPLKAGSTSYTVEESRRNFENVSKLVNTAKPETSVLLIHPLAHDVGGDQFHSGGRQFRTKDDPDWQTLLAWVRLRK